MRFRRVAFMIAIVCLALIVVGCKGAKPAPVEKPAARSAAERPTVVRPTVAAPAKVKPTAKVAAVKPTTAPTVARQVVPPSPPTKGPTLAVDSESAGKQVAPRLQTVQARASQATIVAPVPGEGQAMSAFLDALDNEDVSNALDALDAEFDSYRMHGTLRTDIEGQVTDQEYWIEAVREPQAMRIRTKVSGDGSSAVETEIIIIGDTMYMQVGDHWMTATTEGEAMDQMPNGIAALGIAPTVSELQSCQDLGAANVNGMATQHYRCDSGPGAWYAAADGSGSVEGVSEVWISKDLEAVVKTVGQITVQEGGQTTRLDMMAEYSDINAAITISPPAGVSAPTVPDDIPVMDGAEQLTVMESLVSYAVAKPVQEVADYYVAQMVVQGWTYRQNMSQPPDMMGFNKGKRAANVMAGAQGAKTAVTIMVLGQ